MGGHLIRAYSKTQSIIAKSSAESELYGVVRGSAEGLGILTLLSDFGAKDMRVSVGMDASAAMGIVQRQGIGKLRHVEVDVLWLQEQQARMTAIEESARGTESARHGDQEHIDHVHGPVLDAAQPQARRRESSCRSTTPPS